MMNGTGMFLAVAVIKNYMGIDKVIGIAASVATGISLLPQLIKLLRERKAENLSLGMMAVLLSGLILWVIYGIYQEDYIIVTSNSVSLVLNVCIIVLSLKYRQGKELPSR
ncbi:SemiSWEET transporter [Chitinophaga sedimenti]|uniref:SemiSWEET family sugar transporter n=1 Tax=Chitinophaga sedimenti TaxID=2033606 RepID=UPI00200603AE|nr:SemiSWEET transporter [Chitinophaga sedimenti]MCK7554740.1 SemiSWEET transporter [Chitinophaga sedimenti]